MNTVLRQEKKYLIDVEKFLKLSSRLEKILIPDPHNGTHGYMIRSLYFDTPYDTDFFEKDQGLEIRKKIRLRCYDTSHDYAKLEIKQKQGDNQLKRSLTVSKGDAMRIASADYSPLLKYKEDFAAECYALLMCSGYRPKTIVQYNRKAFIAKENKIRITFDNNIVSTESNFDLFSDRLNMYPVLDKFYAVLEVKYNGFMLSYIKQLLDDVNSKELSVSKYALARQHGCRYSL